MSQVDVTGLTQRDVDLAYLLAKSSLGDILNFPTAQPVLTSLPANTAGLYGPVVESIFISDRFSGQLTEGQAASLLNAVLHELLHYNDWPMDPDHNSFPAPDDDVYREARELTRMLLGKYFKLRGKTKCP